MIPALLSLALAREVPTLEEVRADYPYTLEIAGEAKGLRLLDLDDREIATPDALVLVGLPEEARRYEEARSRRNVASIVLWSVGGALLVGGQALGVGADSGELGVLVPALGAATVGSGVAVRFINPKRHLGAWTDEAAVSRALAALPPPSATDAEALFQESRFVLDAEGVVRDADGRRVKMGTLVRVIDMGDLNEEYRHVRRTDRVLWSTTMAAGGVVTGVGFTTFSIGLFVTVFNGNGGQQLMLVGGGATALGVAGLGTGLTGMLLSRSRHEDPTWWMEEPELRGHLGRRDAELRQELGLPTQGASLRVQPVVGPGYVGLNGTF